jgi:hypothetical protein
MKLDTIGNIVYSKSSGPIARDDELTSWVKDTDAIYVAGSSTDVFNPVTMDGMFMKIDLNGNTTCGNTWYIENLLDFNVMFGTSVVTQSTTSVTTSNFTTSPIPGMSFSYICSGTVMVSLTDLDGSGKLKIYPNPAQDELMIKHNYTNSLVLRIIDTSGRVLIERHVQGESSEINLNVSNFNNGVYFLEVISKKDKLIRKITINR